MDNINFITKVSQSDLDNAREIEDYLYDFSGPKRLLKCPWQPEEGNFYCGKYDFGSVSIICDNACDDSTVSWFSESVDIEVDLPEGITHIGDNAFKGRRLDFVNLPSSLIYIGKHPFALTSPFRIKSKSARFTVYRDCLIDNESQSIIHNVSYSGEIEIPTRIKRIEDYAFSRLQNTPYTASFYENAMNDIEENTISIVIPGSVEYLGNNAFENCNIREVVFLGIPSYIGKDVFKGCEQLKKIYVPFNAKSEVSSFFDNEKDIIDETGFVVQKLLQRNLLASNGITDFFKIESNKVCNVYGYIKENKFHFSDENGSEITKGDLSFDRIIVLEKAKNIYKEIAPNKYFEYDYDNKIFAVNDDCNIFEFYPYEDLYIRLDDGDIVIHGSKGNEDEYTFYDNKNHVARFIGNKQNVELSAIDNKWFFYKENNKIRIILNNILLADIFDEINPLCIRRFSEMVSVEAILVRRGELWGWYNNAGDFFEPKYNAVRRLSFGLLCVKDETNLEGVVTVNNEIIISCDNMALEIIERHSSPFITIAYTSECIYTIHVDSNWGKYHYANSWAEFKNPDDPIVDLELSKYYKYHKYHDEEMFFIVVKHESGEEEYFDEYCNEYNWDEFSEWDKLE